MIVFIIDSVTKRTHFTTGGKKNVNNISLALPNASNTTSDNYTNSNTIIISTTRK